MKFLWSNEKPPKRNLMEKSDEKPLTKTFYLKTCLFNISYSNMDSSNFHIRKYFRKPKKSTPVRLEQSTSESLVRHFNHWAAESVDIQCKWFLYNTKQQEVTGVIICKSNFSLEICSSRVFSSHFSIWFLWEVFHWTISTLNEVKSLPT